MPFIDDDIYLASGASQLINSWVDPVYKYDSSSFYNWEQDNLPIYDLEDRGDYLLEMHGYPTSSVVGMTLTVSDCGIDNKRVFATVDEAVKAIPNTIRFPIIIEVAASGNLGSLYLEDKTFEGSLAGLEIINTGFAKVLVGDDTAASATIATIDSDSSSIATFTSTDLKNTFDDLATLHGDSLYATNTLTQWWSKTKRAFVLPPEWATHSDSGPTKTVDISVKFEDDLNAFGANGGTSFTVASAFSANDNSTGLDISPDTAKDQSFRPDILTGSTSRVTGLVYGNYLKDVHITNCSGRVYLRGFCVDGGSQAILTSAGSQDVDVGISVKNSDVVIENCTTTRCKTAGIKIENSNVVLNRGFISYRNYELVNDGGYLDSRTSHESYGMLAINSNVTLSGATSEFKGLPIDSPFCFLRNSVGIKLKNSNLMTPEKSGYGLDIEGTVAGSTKGQQTLVLQTFLNTSKGIEADNSTIESKHRISVFQNQMGAELINCTLKTLNLDVGYNFDEGLLLNGTEIIYNDSLTTKVAYSTGPFSPCNSFASNGQHLVMKNSQVLPKRADAMPDYYSTFGFEKSIGYKEKVTNGKVTLPMVELSNGSRFDVIGGRFLNTSYDVVAGAGFYTGGDSNDKRVPVMGAAALVKGGSTLNLLGVAGYQTLAAGTSHSDKQQFTFGFVAVNNSKIRASGPTTVVQYGVDFFADDNSTIELCPHKTDSGDIDVAGFSLGTAGNHTTVQLHSSRACLIANNNSSIKIEDVGDYNDHWDAKYSTDLDYNTRSGGLSTKNYIKSGYLQFYPNPFAEIGTGALGLTSQLNVYSNNAGAFVVGPQVALTTHDNDVSGISWGGMCVRALGNSEVKVKNTHFPCGWFNTSEAYYDASASECSLLRIWNIADNSKLDASYLSIASNHPQDTSASYYGPYATYASGASVHLSGAPFSTPDTGPLSVLDAFGESRTLFGGAPIPDASWDGLQVGRAEPENTGAFRLYVSVDPKAKFLGYVTGDEGTFNAYNGSDAPHSLAYHSLTNAVLHQGPPYQLLCQGYNPSLDCSGPIEFSSVYGEFGGSSWVEENTITSPPANSKWTAAVSDAGHFYDFAIEASSVLEASSFYYAKDLLARFRPSIWLDHSALNSFANAKNALLGKSNRGNFVNYYETRTLSSGESWSDPISGNGLGFKSTNLFDPNRYL